MKRTIAILLAAALLWLPFQASAQVMRPPPQLAYAPRPNGLVQYVIITAVVVGVCSLGLYIYAKWQRSDAAYVKSYPVRVTLYEREFDGHLTYLDEMLLASGPVRGTNAWLMWGPLYPDVATNRAQYVLKFLYYTNAPPPDVLAAGPAPVPAPLPDWADTNGWVWAEVPVTANYAP